MDDWRLDHVKTWIDHLAEEFDLCERKIRSEEELLGEVEIAIEKFQDIMNDYGQCLE